MLVAVDLSDRSDRVIRQARRFVTKDSDVILLHVVCDLDSLLGPYVCEKPEKLQADLVIEGKAQLQRLTAECFSGDMRPKELVVTGVPWSEIVGTAIRHRADAIVLGGHAEDKPEHRILGSTVTRVVRHAGCPVVVVPSE